jgi:phage terminase large subunit GpA-like protein
LRNFPAHIETFAIGGFLRGIRPDPLITLQEWAESKRELPPTSAFPGLYSTDKTPYVREIMQRLSATDPAQRIIWKKSAQVGATETGLNLIGYIIDVVPAPTLYVMPTDTLMRLTSKKRIQPLIDSTPSIRHKIQPSKSRDSGNTILEKTFEGGFLQMVGANSPVGLSSSSIRNVTLDEVDRMPGDVAGEGSPIELASTRTMMWGDRRKEFILSTPTIKGHSLIDAEFQTTGQRYYHVPCPFCGVAQVLKFEQLKYEKGKYNEAKYQCIHCNDLIPERYKKQMLEGGMWIPEKPELEDGITFGYHINALYATPGTYTWGKMAKEYEESADDLNKRVTWVNTKKGECYEVEGDAPQWEIIYNQRKSYQKGTCKAQVAFITAGVDIQGDRIELEIVGWMEGKRSQSIDYRILLGDTSQAPVWDMLAVVLNEMFLREDGAQLPIAMMAIDSGHNTSNVYEFCNKYASTGRVIPIKGQDKLPMVYAAPKPTQVLINGKAIGSVKVYGLGVSHLKSELYGWLKAMVTDGETPPGYCLFPEYGETYFRGLTAEKLESTVDKKGFRVLQWVKTYNRNEPLDCRIYARGAAGIYGMDLLQPDHWKRLLEAVNNLAPQKTKKKRENPYL